VAFREAALGHPWRCPRCFTQGNDPIGLVPMVKEVGKLKRGRTKWRPPRACHVGEEGCRLLILRKVMQRFHSEPGRAAPNIPGRHGPAPACRRCITFLRIHEPLAPSPARNQRAYWNIAQRLLSMGPLPLPAYASGVLLGSAGQARCTREISAWDRENNEWGAFPTCQPRWKRAVPHRPKSFPEVPPCSNTP